MSVRRLISVPLILILATLIHVDWHFARPLHHRLSLAWSSHWLFGLVFFVAAGWHIARKWPNDRWAAAAWNVTLAIVVAQVLEPVLEAAFYEQRLAYEVEPERWRAFGECVGAGVPAMVATLLALRSTRR